MIVSPIKEADTRRMNRGIKAGYHFNFILSYHEPRPQARSNALYKSTMKVFWIILTFSLFRAGAEEPVPAKLPEGTSKVAVMLYDYLEDRDHPDIETKGKLHAGVIPGSTKFLTPQQIERLLKALTQNHAQTDRLVCAYAPHHGIVFQGKDGKILGSVSVCFSCWELQSRTFPKNGSEFYTYWGWSELKEIMKDAGIPILRSDEEYTALRIKRSKQGVTRPELKSQGSDKTQSEAESGSR